MHACTPEMLRDAIATIPADWLRERRWFSSKGRALQSLTVDDWGALSLDQPAIIALARARYDRGRDELYLLPLLATEPALPDGGRMPPAATIEEAGTRWYVHDAFQFAGFQRWLMETFLAGGELPMREGKIRFQPEAALLQSPPPLGEIKLVTAEQSNNSIIYDRQAILKCFRRVVAGLNPDVEVSRFLSQVGFPHTPDMLGSIGYINGAGVEHSLGLLQSFVPNQGDAWEQTIRALDQFLAITRAHDHIAPDTIVARTRLLAAEQLHTIQELGMLTAELHLALASDPHDPDFAPQPLTPELVQHWQRTIRAESEALLTELERRAVDLPPEYRDPIVALLQARPRVQQRIAALEQLGQAGVVTTRFHGDYHLGQILVSERGLLVLDFEGEPLRSLAERRAHHSPLKDVAGMLRSLSYAAQTGLRNAQFADQQHPTLGAWVSEWEQQARMAYLNGYLDVARGAAFLPEAPDVFTAAVAVFELEKAFYELNYELNNRPDWLLIPLRGIQRTL